MLRLMLSGTTADRWCRLGTGFAAWILAELFYKWHSFTLECAGFLATWLALEGALSAFRARRTAAQVNRSA